MARKNPVEWTRSSSSSGFATARSAARGVPGEHRRRDLVDHLVGALGREDRGDQQLERRVVHELAQLRRAPRVLLGEALAHDLGPGLGAARRPRELGHRGLLRRPSSSRGWPRSRRYPRRRGRRPSTDARRRRGRTGPRPGRPVGASRRAPRPGRRRVARPARARCRLRRLRGVRRRRAGRLSAGRAPRGRSGRVRPVDDRPPRPPRGRRARRCSSTRASPTPAPGTPRT